MNKGKKSNSAFMKPVRVSKKLAHIVGGESMPRTEVTKKLWDYIKKHGLQDAQKKRIIKPDAALAEVFGSKEPVDMFEMTKLVNKHLEDPQAASKA